MQGLLDKIVLGILRQEGESKTELNPGNLRNAPWLDKPKVSPKGFWIPESRSQGVAGIYHVVALKIAKGMSLSQLINSYAPPTDSNPTSQYIQNVKSWAGIPDENLPLWNYLEGGN